MAPLGPPVVVAGLPPRSSFALHSGGPVVVAGLAPRSSRIMHTLRLGVTQLLWLETPPHAAVHSAVEMTKQIKMEKYSGLVNAVLKRVSRESLRD